MTKKPRPSRGDGFTLIELLIVVAIIGILAALIIPNLLDAIQKAHQKRSVADIRNVGSSWMAWLTDQVSASAAGQAQTYDYGTFGTVTYAELFAYLHPNDDFFYMQEVPQFDGWANALTFYMNTNLLSSSVMLIAAPAQDGLYETVDGSPIPVGPFITTDYAHDIAWADGYMVTYPGNVNP